MSSQPTRVLFVCLGNICRSPAAEGVFLDLLERENLSDAFEVDSAGTGHWHVGKRADPRMRAAAERRGIDLPSRARQIEPEDLSRFDWIITMDDSNLANVRPWIPVAAATSASCRSPATAAVMRPAKCPTPTTAVSRALSMYSICSKMPAAACSSACVERLHRHALAEEGHDLSHHLINAEAITEQLHRVTGLTQRSYLAG